jgi:hypothetical protein
VNLRQLGYLVVCAAALLYLVNANARGYVPFAGPALRSGGGFSSSGGHYLFFHK